MYHHVNVFVLLLALFVVAGPLLAPRTAAAADPDPDSTANAPPPNATLVLFPAADYPHARCLDGSPFGVYFRPAPVDADPVSRAGWMVVLNGGGLCTHEADCTARAATDLGTSTVFPKTFPLASVALLSPDARNPFRNWNLLFLPYCSGDMHAGQRTTADNVTTWGLYFSGFHNVMATVDFMSAHHGLNTSGNTLVWSGGSAGGVGVFSTLDRVAALLTPGGVRVVGAPVGGFPPEVYWSRTAGSTPPSEDVRTPAFKANNALFDAVLPPACAAALGEDVRYMCGVPHIAYKYMQTPTFIIEALTDVVISCQFEGMPCSPVVKALLNPDNWNRWAEYGNNCTEMLGHTVLQRARDGVFAPSCLMHTGFTLEGPLIDGLNAVQATWNWLFPGNATSANQTNQYIDSCAHGKLYPPCGKKCPPLTRPMLSLGGYHALA